MGPTSSYVLVGVLLVAVALMVVAIRLRQMLVKVVAAVLCLAVSVFSGAIIVNDFFGYYTSWGAAVADLTGNGNTYALHAAAAELNRGGHSIGRVEQVTLAGTQSGITRTALIYLPPQYDQAAYGNVRFPVIELLHGTPGDPGIWVNVLHVTQYVSYLIDKRAMGPVVLVMPDSNGGLSGAQECLDTSSFKDDTYISADVPTDIRAKFRVSADPAQWGLLGFSSGGYCAANLMMRHRADFGAAAMIDGYYRPTDGPAAARLGYNVAAEQANDPLAAALALPPGSSPLPPCWIAAGTGVRSDFQAGLAFANALRRLESVSFLVEKGAHHTAAADRAALPAALTWSWQQLATPAQRTQFPTVSLSSDLRTQLIQPAPQRTLGKHSSVLAKSERARRPASRTHTTG